VKNPTIYKAIIYFSIAIIILSLPAITMIFQERITGYLEKTETTNADILIVEGWLSDFAIERAMNEFNDNGYSIIVTTGIESDDLDFCMIPMNGYLIFYPDSNQIIPGNEKLHLIEILAHSKMGGKYSSHFNFYINDSLTAEFIADEKARRYGVTWSGSLKDIDSLMVHFDDDYLDEGGDKNLYVKEITIDHEITIPYQYQSIYDIGRLDGKNIIVNDYDSQSGFARNKLIRIGIDPAKVVAVNGERTKVNRTLSSALAFRRWLKSYNGNVDGINIISKGIHSRRTMMTYKSILGKKIKIGIIALPESEKPGFHGLKYRDVLSEVLNLVYYRIILIPCIIFR